MPNRQAVIDYFRWRNEDAHRNALNAHCYWMLRKKGDSVQKATNFLSGMSVSEKNELLFQNCINFNDIPNWQKRGIGLYWETYEKPYLNQTTGVEITAQRRRVKIDCELPMKDQYSEFISKFLEDD